jgi:curli biogenesis system outer membrane secretion channel CsgG
MTSIQQTSLRLFSLVFTLSILFVFPAIGQQKVEIEKVREKCKNIPFEERVRISVTKFDVETPKAPRGEFGKELATMLTNALHQINCFRILESVINMDDMTKEIEIGQGGYTADGSSPTSGKMLGAQAIVTGSVTEFSESNGEAGAFGIKFGSKKARIGFILKVINPETRDVLWSRSIEAESRKPGSFKGLKLFGIELAGGSKYNKAVADAVERGIIKAMYTLGEEKDDIPFPAPNSGVAEVKEWNYQNCPTLQSDVSPSIMLAISETYISNRYYPETVSETEIVNRLIRAGFKVIDPALYAAIKKDASFKQALKDPTAAMSLGSKFGADIIIIGNGTTQNAGKASGGTSVRATLDLRGIRTDNGQIVLSNSTSAAAIDVAINAASQNAYKRAGTKAANDFLEQLCTSPLITQGSFGNTASQGNRTTLKISGVDFATLRKITKLLESSSKVTKVERDGFANNEATLQVSHEGSTDDIADIIFDKASNMLEVTSFEGNSIETKMKR